MKEKGTVAPTDEDTLKMLQKECDRAENRYDWADLLIRAPGIFCLLVAVYCVFCFENGDQPRLSIAGAILFSLAAASIWIIGTPWVKLHKRNFERAEKRIDEFINLPVS